MGKAIAFLTVLVVCSFAFVLLQLSLRRNPHRAAVAEGPTPVLQNREDGTVYAVSLELKKFERRLMEEEKRSQRLLQELEALRSERTELADQVVSLDAEVRRLRRQVAEIPRRPGPPPAGEIRPVPPANAPPANAPAPPPTPPVDGPL